MMSLLTTLVGDAAVKETVFALVDDCDGFVKRVRMLATFELKGRLDCDDGDGVAGDEYKYGRSWWYCRSL